LIKVLLLQGGYNEEHEVSLNTAKEITKSLRKLNIHYKVLTVNPLTFNKDIKKYPNSYVCLNALHGTFGEDGKIQNIIKNNKFRITHSNKQSSYNCFNKTQSKKIIKKFKILTPPYENKNCRQLNTVYFNKIQKKFKKFVIKPVSSGSSYGLRIIKSKKDLDIFYKELNSFKNNFQKDEKFIIEKYISGKELTVSILEYGSILQPLEVTEIISLNKLYDYEAKYKKGFSKHFIPARISKKNHRKCLNLALKIHKIFKCNTLSRVDFILNEKQNKVYFLEINSQPGLTKLSLLPEQANFKKIKFEKIILNLLNNAA
tara:strand:- start:138 stop:1082 length:945 start_codon:yes stop_codon:yes gene_type:complete